MAPTATPRVKPFPHPGYQDASCVQVADGSIFTIDDTDLPEVARQLWRRTGGGYVITQTGPKCIYLHRMLMGVVDRSREVEVDHRNNDPLDNRRSNLRLADRSQNGANSTRYPGRTDNPRSRHRGVYWVTTRNKWRAMISIDGKQKFLGEFHDEDAAGQAYDVAALARSGEFARLNFPAPS